MCEESAMERLDAFFAEGANTDAIGDFLWEMHDLIQQLDASNDSSEALELHSLFKRYAAVVDSLLCTFVEREAETNSDVSLEKLATLVLREWEEQNQEQSYCRYLCTSYIAGALDFDSFRQLMADVNAITTYPVGDEMSEGDSASEGASCTEGG